MLRVFIATTMFKEDLAIEFEFTKATSIDLKTPSLWIPHATGRIKSIEFENHKQGFITAV